MHVKVFLHAAACLTARSPACCGSPTGWSPPPSR